jgi:hypothetical protein
MIKFEKKFLYTFADVEDAEKLIGKKGIFFDEPIGDYDLENKPLYVLTRFSPESPTPFEFEVKGEYDNIEVCDSTFFYFDPNLECKRAYVKGKTIQTKNIDNEWVDCPFNPGWLTGLEYRIKPETKTRLTVREVAKWLADGNGEIKLNSGQISTSWAYVQSVENDPCNFEIRKWSDSEWHKPTKEYIEGVK